MSETTKAIEDVAAERERQRRKWGDSHDDGHRDGSLAWNGGRIALNVDDPWGLWEKHREDRRRQLVISAALIVAEIERLDRKARSEEGGEG